METMVLSRHKTTMITPDRALAGRDTRPFSVPSTHYVLSTPLEEPYPDGLEVAYFGLGCFWGAERTFWQVEGVISTAVGYQGGLTPNPTYDEVCSARTGHAEVVKVVYDPKRVSYAELLRVFWESHDPTQGMRQGNDTGTQYRSAIFTTSPEQQAAAEASARDYQPGLTEAGYGEITTQIAPATDFFYAEDYHQQYLAKNPGGYCPVHATGVSCPVGLGVKVEQ
jgi:peptide-methionine (S)-S-oxide reductase